MKQWALQNVVKRPEKLGFQKMAKLTTTVVTHKTNADEQR